MAGLVGVYTTDALDAVHSSKLIGEMAKGISYTHNDITDQWYKNKLSVARVHHGVINPQQQPIFNEDNSICIFMDGEVFDYDSEKPRLVSQGHRFRLQDNDAEYCLHLYEEHGTEAFSKLNGSFIIALHHLDSGEFLLVNDRISSRPVFYRWDGKQLIFASQLRPILKTPDLSPELDIQAILEFFAFRSVLSDGTFYKDVKILPPATVLRISNGELSFRQYWRWEYKGEPHREAYYVEAFTEALKRAVQRRTRGDHRIGLLLSGGLDSRTLLAADTEKRISVAFTLADFENRELQIARRIAAATGRRHIFLQRDIDHYYRLVDEAVDIGDGMYGFENAHNLGFFERICAEADVLLHAFGFDTLFKALFVPPKHVKMFAQHRPIPVPAIPRDASEPEAISTIVPGSLVAQVSRLFRIPQAELMERLRSSAASVLRTSFGANASISAVDMIDRFYFSAAYRCPTYLHALHNRAFIDERTVAFDNELLDLAFDTPVEFKFGGRLIKKVLTRLSSRIATITNANTGLPAIMPVSQEWLLLTAQAELTRRGILKSAPLPHPAFTHGSWPNFAELIRYNQNLKGLIKSTIEDADCFDDSLFNRDSIEDIYQKHVSGEADYANTLLLLLTFGRWHKKYGPARNLQVSSAAPMPSKIRLEVSSACQLKCPSCPRTTTAFRSVVGSGFLKFADFKKLVDDNPWVKEIELSNYGEIFLNPELPAVLRYAHERGIVLRADSGVNLNHVTDEALEALVRYGLRSMTVSIDGASNDTYKTYRVRGSLENVIRNIKKINMLKERYRSEYPRLTWQFIAFGHNQHEIEKARQMANELGMNFYVKLTWDDNFSPLRDPGQIRRIIGAATRKEYRLKYGKDYVQDTCHQLWDEPQINWDGKVLGCCRNFWGDFGGNAFTDGLLKSINSERMQYAREMLMGRKPPRYDIPCSTCSMYTNMKAEGKWLRRPFSSANELGLYFDRDSSDAELYCPFCQKYSKEFLPTGLDIPVLKEKKVIGGGYRPNATCPNCGSIDRERLVYLYLKDKTRLFHENLRLLHVAPEANLQKVLKSLPNIDYHSVDLNSPLAAVHMDITDMKYPSDCFDVIICNHVLEHIPDDRKAMSELYRVLKPGGWAILQVPISLSLKRTYEDPRITSPQERERCFGQSDHVRIYARDYTDRLREAGFCVQVYSFTDELGHDAVRRYGLIQGESVYICSKPDAQPSLHSETTSAHALHSRKENALCVCFFSHSAWLNGAERSLLELVTELIQDYGVLCTVILPEHGPLKERLEAVDAATHIINYCLWWDRQVPQEEELDSTLRSSINRTLYEVKHTLAKINPDVIVTNTLSIPWGALAAALMGKPHIWFAREFGEQDHGLKTFLPFDRVLDIVNDLSDVIITNSEAVRKALFPHASRQKVRVIYPCVTIPDSALVPDGEPCFTRQNSAKLVISASVKEGKGQQYAVLAVKELVARGRDVELVIMGDMSTQYAERLQHMVQKYHLEEYVKFTGFKDNPYPVMNQADIVVVCSRNEAFGRATVEAMLLKKPVIATASGGTLELVKDGRTGLLYQPGDYQALASKIEYLIEHPDRARKLAENAYRFASRTFTRENFGGKVYRIMADLKQKASARTVQLSAPLPAVKMLETVLQAARTGSPEINSLIAELASATEAKDSQIAELTNSLQAKDSQIAELTNSLQAKDSQIAELTRALHQVQRGIVMHFLNRYQRFIEKLLPRGTRGRYYYELVLSGVRIILDEGWESFWFRFKQWLKQQSRRRRRIKAQPAVTYTADAWSDYWTLSQEVAAARHSQLSSFKGKPPRLISVDENKLAVYTQSLAFPAAESPSVSIVVYIREHNTETVECLVSLLSFTHQPPYEVIVVDDGATQQSEEVTSLLKKVTYLRNEQSLGFALSCNRAVKQARGRFVVFIQSSIQFTESWLSSLIEAFTKYDKTGAVGPKILSPDGRLQAAGAKIKLDASSEPIGLGDNPDRPRYNYVREVDYCPPACLAVETALLRTLGGFDTEFATAEHAVSDLCFRIRQLGRTILYNPYSVVVGKSSAVSRANFGQQPYHIIQSQQRLLEKWHELIDNYNRVKLIAFYLPQFHPIAENDLWWGKGFTEWTNVTKAQPNFVGHYQPHLPADLGFYDLRVQEVMEEQAELAKRYGIYGFCYYYYWFSGKRLLEMPLERLLKTGKPDIPFCLCWANDNWTRRWIHGCESEVLMAQRHSDEDDRAVITDIMRYMRRPNYIRIKGKPLLLVYRADLFPDIKRTAETWRSLCRREGIGEIYLALVESFEPFLHNIEKADPSAYGFDSSVECPPHFMYAPIDPPGELLNPQYEGTIHDYHKVVLKFVQRGVPAYTRFRTVSPGWDDTPRRQNHSNILVNSTPGAYQVWLENVVKQTLEQNFGEERIVFINAWNEWAEGMYIEPDQRFGHGFLEATRNALDHWLLNANLLSTPPVHSYDVVRSRGG